MAVIKDFDGKILLSTLWNQSGIIKCGNNQTVEFNCYAPTDPLYKQNSYTGCVNTAMGQVSTIFWKMS